ncbi:sensor histidine kinase [Flavobacterium glaciei]|uniref:histidine kinase n=1 Tax=Flavobacterium glaciei TaxID=386300 RepID=A0A562Q569_9FLAO|nr:ATP-binding protein [Flavobacterium glaciei]RDI58100.1 histidine kinase/DNA gyrase B/HSP90-like ATPase [Flavobacterium glaciei]TWI51889.1 histidine kinase/DNA gyrase B/HSP90-like ATPase [Flavobacterium glaciei]
MLKNLANEKEIVEIIFYISGFFIVIAVTLILFFYFSRKKIIQKELEKKDLEIQYQKELLSAVIITQEEERKRIAQDLHDDISSKLNIVSLNSYLLTAPNLTENETLGITKTIIELTSKALDNSRKIAHGLLPPVLEKFGLHAGIEELCLEFSSSKVVEIQYENKTSFDITDNDRHLHVFRILQELMNNSLRHGKASTISIVFEKKNDVYWCFYSDDGIGFEMKNNENQKGLGMKNIESRIAFLNGKITFESSINKGISVVFNF